MRSERDRLEQYETTLVDTLNWRVKVLQSVVDDDGIFEEELSQIKSELESVKQEIIILQNDTEAFQARNAMTIFPRST